MPYKDPEAQREYQRQWKADRRAEFFADKTCQHCGSLDRLELHHVDPRLKVSHKIWSWSAQRRAAELEKCIILCHDCHLIETEKDFPGSTSPQHRIGSYRKGCRCDSCRAANTARVQRQRQKEEQ